MGSTSSPAPFIDFNRWRSCYAYTTAPPTQVCVKPNDDGSGNCIWRENATWAAAAQKASDWAANICRVYSPSVCLAYGKLLTDCGGGDVVLKWYQNGQPSDPDVTRWMCEQGYASPLYPKFYPIHGVCPVRGPQAEGAVKPQIEAVMVQYNDREPIFWPVSPRGCEPGLECSFQFFFPCEPLIPGKEPRIIDGGWIWKTEPGRIRPSGITEAQR